MSSPQNSRIWHNIIEKEEPGSISQYLKEKLELDCSQTRFLIDLGAIYLDKKRVTSDLVLKPAQYLRVHSQPRRFSKIEKINWASTIFDEQTDFLVVNKPGGIPTHATLDNQIENVTEQLGRYLGQKLYPAHRLDIGTSGLLILTKNSTATARFHEFFEAGEIKKFYEAIVFSPEKKVPRVGLWRHQMLKTSRAPKSVEALAKDEQVSVRANECLMNVLKANQVVPNSSPSMEDRFFRLQIELMTGRTHQIRAQLSHEGFSILGDQLYGSPFDFMPRTDSEVHIGPTALQIGEQNSEAIALVCGEIQIPSLGKKWSLLVDSRT